MRLKRKSLIDEEFLAKVRELPCIACGRYGATHAHHIRSRGAGGDDAWWNVIPLCDFCHVLSGASWHKGGISKFLNTRPWVIGHLKALGWEFDGTRLFRSVYEQ